MITDLIARLIRRELRTLEEEVRLYREEADLWKTPPGIRNPGGNLALHMAGNLRHFIGARLGGTGYVRDRDAEFARKDVPRAEILAEIGRAAEEVQAALSRLDPASLSRDFPDEVAGRRVKTGDYLVHLCVHLGYHLGQIGYHRRMTTGSEASANAVSPKLL